MKNKSEFFIKHFNYFIYYTDILHTCQDLVIFTTS